VFVELVGRGFDEEVLEETDVERDSIDHDDSDDPRAPDRPPTRAIPPTSRASAKRKRRSCEHGVRLPRDGEPAGGGRLDAPPDRMTDLRTIVGRAYPRVRGMAREKSWVFFEVLLPFLATSAFVFVYRALQAPPQYIGFVVLGGAMTAFWLNVIWMMGPAAVVGEEPGQPRALLRRPDEHHGRPVRDGLRRLRHEHHRATAVLVIATTIFGVTFAVDQWALLIAVFFLTLAALYGLGMVLASPSS
jgi:hypothetical protein